MFQDDLRVYLLMSLVQGGELYSQLRKVERCVGSRRTKDAGLLNPATTSLACVVLCRFSEERALFYVCQLVVVLEVLQGMDVVHRDIKPEVGNAASQLGLIPSVIIERHGLGMR